MASTEVEIVNHALSLLGNLKHITAVGSGTVAELTDTSAKVVLAQQFFDQDRDALLRMHDWRFARKYTTLTQVDDGTGEVWIDEWDSAYAYPTDCIKIRSILKGDTYTSIPFGLPSLRNPEGVWRYEVKVHDSAKVIMSDIPPADAKMEYTERVEDVTRWLANPHFTEALAWRLAWHFAPSLHMDRSAQDHAYAMHMRTFQWAQAYDINEDNPYVSERKQSKYISARFR